MELYLALTPRREMSDLVAKPATADPSPWGHVVRSWMRAVRVALPWLSCGLLGQTSRLRATAGTVVDQYVAEISGSLRALGGCG